MCESQIIIVLSQDPETICLPLGEYATDVTLSVWPFKGSPICALVLQFHIQSVPSQDAETKLVPSGEYAIDTTLSL
jgi:hypothetical protein